MIIQYEMLYTGRGNHQWVEFCGWFIDWSAFAAFKERQRNRMYAVRNEQRITFNYEQDLYK